jgi:hypothetical protein
VIRRGRRASADRGALLHEEFSMTQAQLEDAVACATGESITTIRSLGFSLEPHEGDDTEPEILGLAVICPCCHEPVPYAGLTRDGSPTLGECLACDIFFDVAIGQIFASGLAA